MIIRWNDQRFTFARHSVYLIEGFFIYVIGEACVSSLLERGSGYYGASHAGLVEPSISG